MTMKKLLLFFMLTSLVFLFSTARTIKKYNTKKVSTTLLKTQAYTNKAFGISFQYPITWVKDESENNIINLSGDTTTIEITFIDTISKSNLLLIYHLPPNGHNIYKFAQEQFKLKQGIYTKNSSQISISGTNAYRSYNSILFDGKENKLVNPLTSISLIFLDKKKNGTFELQFQTLQKNSSQVLLFNQLLSTIKFIIKS